MSDAARRLVGRTLAALAVDLDALAAEITQGELTDGDWECLEVAHLHLLGAFADLDEALSEKYAQRDHEQAAEVIDLRRYAALRGAA